VIAGLKAHIDFCPEGRDSSSGAVGESFDFGVISTRVKTFPDDFSRLGNENCSYYRIRESESQALLGQFYGPSHKEPIVHGNAPSRQPGAFHEHK
jgi:hypothetical protein